MTILETYKRRLNKRGGGLTMERHWTFGQKWHYHSKRTAGTRFWGSLDDCPLCDSL